MDTVVPLRLRLDELRAHAATARTGIDPAGVHQLRVTASRLSAWLVLGEHRALLDDLAWLRREVGRARDLDVLARVDQVPSSLRAWIERERACERPRVLSALDSPRLQALIEALVHLARPKEKELRRALHRLRERVFAAGARFSRASGDLEDAHRLRRRIRRLRHAHEWVGTSVPALRAAQTDLGRVNDEATLLHVVSMSPLAADLAAWSAERARAIDVSVGAAREGWKRLAVELERG